MLPLITQFSRYSALSLGIVYGYRKSSKFCGSKYFYKICNIIFLISCIASNFVSKGLEDIMNPFLCIYSMIWL